MNKTLYAMIKDMMLKGYCLSPSRKLVYLKGYGNTFTYEFGERAIPEKPKKASCKS